MKTFFQFMEDMGMSDQQFGKDQGEGLTTMQKGVMNKFFNALEQAVAENPSILNKIVNIIDSASETETELRPMIAKLKNKQVKGYFNGSTKLSHLPEGSYWFFNDHATPMVGQSVLKDGERYRLPNQWFQNLINK